MARWSKRHDSAALAARFRTLLARRQELAEKRMLGGVCFLHRGNMLCGAGGPGFRFRVGRQQDRKVLSRKGANPMTQKGKRFTGFVSVDPAACDTRALRRWIALADRYVATLPAK